VVEPEDLAEHAQVPPAAPAHPSEQPAQAAPARVLQTAAGAAHRHAHLGTLGAHPEFGEQPGQQRVGPLVTDDKAAVHAQFGAVRAQDPVRVGVPAQPVVGLEQRHLAGAREDVGGSEAAHPAADDRYLPTG
jgi:hypothetical protein